LYNVANKHHLIADKLISRYSGIMGATHTHARRPFNNNITPLEQHPLLVISHVDWLYLDDESLTKAGVA